MSFSHPTHAELVGAAFAVALVLVACQALADSPPTLPTLPVLVESNVPAHDFGIADGQVPDGVTVFDDQYPAVDELDRDLLAALRAAATDSGVAFEISSGWRSEAYQRQVFEQAVARYGSEEAAAPWVARPGTSIHELGDAVDISNADATSWLAQNGGDYGLCQIYANEPWHYELRPAADDNGCPPMYADAAHDPRMRS
jgi:D-alanyl-D-alanine carboxypeptidase